ncbi:MAG: two-component system sensor histidine kinase HydH [Planctomycetota bacterium]|jgi:two-component system sensor histidine kinase HydH
MAKPNEPVGEKRGSDEIAILSRLAAGLAHEIKNPLSTMAINLALLEEDWQLTAPQRGEDAAEPTPRQTRLARRIKTLKREVHRLENILDDFLHYARGGEVNRAPANLSAVVRDVLEFVESEHEAQSIRHHVDLPLSLPLVLVDEDRIKQALVNLFRNSAQAMPEGGELLVRLVRRGNHVELTVTDTGVGMTPEQLERCFDVYWSTKKGGTGLGLATTRRIVELHSGTIAVTSEQGRGTSITITLPLVVEIPNPDKPGDIVVEPISTEPSALDDDAANTFEEENQ